jgi:FKBP-type peptidyl-prolyl cis-trans isomerase
MFIQTSAVVLDPVQTTSLCDKLCGAYTRQLEYSVAMCTHWHWLNCKDHMPMKKEEEKKKKRKKKKKKKKKKEEEEEKKKKKKKKKQEEEKKKKKKKEEEKKTCRSRVQRKHC